MPQYSHWCVQLREVAMAATPATTVNVRYMVDDVDAAVAWYTKHLGFKLLSDAAPAFADVTLGSLRLLLSGPKSSAGRAMPDGDRPGPGGWNRIHLVVDDISAEVARLRAAGVEFRNDIVSGPGGSQILLRTPPAISSSCFSRLAADRTRAADDEARLASQLATGAGAARKLRVAYQSRWRLLLYPGLCAVCGRITNWRSPLGNCRKKSTRSSVVELPSWMPRIMSTGESTFLGSTSGRLAAEIGPGRDLFAELEFHGGDGLGHGHVVARGVAVAGEDRADHGRVALAAIVVAVELDLLPAPADLRRAGAFVGEGDQHQPVHPLGLGLRERGGADGTGGGAVEMHFRLPGLPRHHRHRGFEVLDAAGHVGIVA